MNKKILISVSIIAVLILYIIVANLKHSSDVPDLPVIQAGANEILINREAGVVKLFMKDGKWVVGDKAYPADPKQVEEIQKRFKEIRLTDLISSKGYYAKYDLTPDKYAEIILKKGDVILRKFKIGKKSSTNRHTFVRLDDRPEIYLAEGTFDIVLNKSADDFRDREVLKIKTDAVSAITVDYRGMTFAFSRAKEKAVIAGKKEAGKAKTPVWGPWTCRGFETVTLDAARVNALVQVLDPLRALSFPDIAKETLAQQICEVRIRAYNKDIILTVYNKDNTYVAATSEYPYVFEVDKYTIEKFFISGIEGFKAVGK